MAHGVNNVFTVLRFKVHSLKLKTNEQRDFPGGSVVKNPPSSAGEAGSIRGRVTKILHAAGQLSPRATTIELASLNERARMPQTTEPTRSGACVPQLERENPHATTREKPSATTKSLRTARKDPACLNKRCSQKKKENK